MVQRLLNGEVEYVDSEPAIDHAFADRVGDLEDRIAVLEEKLATVKRDAVVALLNMLSESMRHIASSKMDIPAQATNSKWDVIKNRLQPRLREAVDILLIQGPMKRTQLSAALKMDYSNCSKNVVAILLRQGLMIEVGGNLTLRQL